MSGIIFLAKKNSIFNSESQLTHYAKQDVTDV